MIMKNSIFLALGTLLAAIILTQGAWAAGFELNLYPGKVSVCPCSAITPQHVTVSVNNLYHSADTYTFTLTPPAGWSSEIQDSLTLASGEEKSLDLFLINTGCSVQAGVYTAAVTAKSAATGESISKTLNMEVLLCRGIELTATEDYQDACFEEALPVEYGMMIKNMGKFEETFALSSPAAWAGFPEDEITLGAGETESFSVFLDPEGLQVGLHEAHVNARSLDPKSPLYYTPATKKLGLEVKDCYDFSADIQPKENDVCFGESAAYAVMIENTGLREDTYLIYTPEWITSEETEVSLEPGQKAALDIEATPGSLGKLDVSVTVSSSGEPELSMKATASVVSRECRDVAVIVSPAEYEVCGGLPPVSFTVSVKNTGATEDEYVITSTKGTLEKGSLALRPDETGTTGLEVDITGLEGEVSITVAASDGVVSDEATISMNVRDCYSANLTVTPSVQSICPYESVAYMITIENTGELPDAYVLRYGDEAESLELDSGEYQEFELVFLVPFEEAGVYVVSAFADSDHVSISETAALNVKTMDSCYNAEIVAEATNRIKPCTIDECDAVILPVEISNTGEKPASFSLFLEGPEWAYVEPMEFGLGPGESGVAYLYLSPGFGTEEDTYPVTIRAESEYIEVTEVIGIIVAENVTAGEPDVSLNVSTGITGAIVGGERPLWKTVVVAIIAVIIIIILAVRFILLVRK
jgi:uncharacterized membrane protein